MKVVAQLESALLLVFSVVKCSLAEKISLSTNIEVYVGEHRSTSLPFISAHTGEPLIWHN